MLNQFSRTQLLLGTEAMEKLKRARVAVFGIGGVGGYVCEALVRSGVGAFDLVDDDKVCLTNLNRQIIATRKTVGKYKVEVMLERILSIQQLSYQLVRFFYFIVLVVTGHRCVDVEMIQQLDTVTGILRRDHIHRLQGLQHPRCHITQISDRRRTQI